MGKAAKGRKHLQMPTNITSKDYRGGMHNNVVDQFGRKAYVATNQFQNQKVALDSMQNAVVASV